MSQPDTLSDIYAGVSQELSEVSARLADAVSECFALLGDRAYGTDMLRGKLVRPALLLMCGKLFNDDVSELVNLATASELVHTATLIHDDVVDSAEMRRGAPSVNARWDDKSAVLCGDRVVCEGLLLLSEYERISATETMLATLKRVVRGEMRQLRPDRKLDEATCIETAREKTGSLMSAVCRLPATWFGADAERVESLARFGGHFGVAFQIVDDLLDLTGEELTLGKTPLSDIRNGKGTLPLVYLKDVIRNDGELERRFSELIDARQPHEQETVWLSELVQESGCAERTLETASGYAAQAGLCLEVFPDSSAKGALLNLLDFVIHRRS
jgi:geranylgeranyl pyrophosphate synthase